VDQSGMRYKGEKGLDQQEVSKWVMWSEVGLATLQPWRRRQYISSKH
jgi:hypothetical protein